MGALDPPDAEAWWVREVVFLRPGQSVGELRIVQTALFHPFDPQAEIPAPAVRSERP